MHCFFQPAHIDDSANAFKGRRRNRINDASAFLQNLLAKKNILKVTPNYTSLPIALSKPHSASNLYSRLHLLHPPLQILKKSFLSKGFFCSKNLPVSADAPYCSHRYLSASCVLQTRLKGTISKGYLCKFCRLTPSSPAQRAKTNEHARHTKHEQSKTPHVAYGSQVHHMW
jgi:hypothetical protein